MIMEPILSVSAVIITKVKMPGLRKDLLIM